MDKYVAEHPWTIDPTTASEGILSGIADFIAPVIHHAQQIIDANRAAAEKEFDRCMTDLKQKHAEETSHLRSLAYDHDKTDLRAQLSAARTRLTEDTIRHEKLIAIKDALIHDTKGEMAKLNERVEKLQQDQTETRDRHKTLIGIKDALINEANEEIAKLRSRAKELQQDQIKTRDRIIKLAAGAKEVTHHIETLVARQEELSKYHESEITRLKEENRLLKKRAAKRCTKPCEGDVFDAISNGSVVLPKRRRSDMM